eukprot:1829055-Amphidinium_carterae.1
MTNLIPAVAAYGGGVALREAVDNAPKPSVHRKDHTLHAVSSKVLRTSTLGFRIQLTSELLQKISLTAK